MYVTIELNPNMVSTLFNRFDDNISSKVSCMKGAIAFGANKSVINIKRLKSAAGKNLQ